MQVLTTKTLLLCLSLSVIIAMPGSLQADEGQFYIVPGLQWMNWHNETMLSNDEGFSLGVGYDFTDRLSGEVSGLWFDPDIVGGGGGDDDYDIWRINLLYGLGNQNSRLAPFVVTGLGEGDSSFEDDTLWDLGVGVKFDVTDNIEWRTAIRNIYSFDRKKADIGIDTGLVFRFGSSGRRSEPAPAPVAVTPTPAPAPAIVDSDGDGVPDSRDDCPNTPRNYAVDDRGCPIPVEEVARVELQVNFEFDRSEVRPQYFSEVQQVADFMNQYSDVIVELEGHTDNVGTEAYNQGLSQRRADAVRQVLIDQFNIQASRVTALGFGESQPIASNDTTAGRADNRRVITVIIKTLQNYQPR